jgi:hypothetical protein
MNHYDINSVGDLVRAASDIRTGGYEADLDIRPNLDKARAGDGFFLIIEATTTEPNVTGFIGEYWFWDDNTVMQVL